MRNKLHIKVFLSIILFIIILIGSCKDSPTLPPVEGEAYITNVETLNQGVLNYRTYEYKITWKTNKMAVSTILLEPEDTTMPTLGSSDTNIKENELGLREYSNTEVLPEQTYHYTITSYIPGYEDTIAPTTITGSFKTEQIINEKIIISGTLVYEQINQPSGEFIVELWNADDPNIFDYDNSTIGPLYRDITIEETVNGDQIVGDFQVFVKFGKYKLRAFRNYSPSGNDNEKKYDPLTEAHVEYLNPIVITDEDFDTNDLTLIEPTAEISSIAFTNPTTDINVKAGYTTDVTLHITDQWGNIFPDPGTVTFESTNSSEVEIVTGYESQTYTGGADQTFSIGLEKATGAPSLPTTQLRATINGNTTTTTSIFTIIDNIIELNLTYTTNGTARYSGNLIVQVSNDGGSTWGYQQVTITPSSTPPLTTTIGDTYSTTLELGVDNGNYRIRAFRDYINAPDNITGYDNNDREAYGIADHNTLGSGDNTIEVSNGDEVAYIDVKEPQLIPSDLQITAVSSNNIRSGYSTDLTIQLYDQWGSLFAQDSFYYNGNVTEPLYNISTQQVNISESVADVEISSGSTGTDSDFDGIITIPVTLRKLSTGLAAVPVTLTAVWDGFPALNDTTSTINVDNNHISGTFSYTNNGDQTNGRLIVELWDKSTTNANFGVGSRLNYIELLITDPQTFDFEVPNSDSGEYYLRIYRDFNSDGYDETSPDDILKDAYQVYKSEGSPATINVSHSDITISDYPAFQNKPSVINGIEIVGLDNNSSPAADETPFNLASGGDAYVKIQSVDQWGTVFGDEANAIDFSWVGAEVTLNPTTATLTSGIANQTITFTETNDGIESGQLQAEYSYTHTNPIVGLQTFTDTSDDQIHIGKNSIFGDITYTQTNQPSGNIIVEAWDDVNFSGTQISSDTFACSGSGTYSYELPGMSATTGTVYIRAYRDYTLDGNTGFTGTTDVTDAAGVYNSGDNHYGNAPDGITPTGSDITGMNFTIYEPDAKITYLVVENVSDNNINSGDNTSVTVQAQDQWRNDIAGDGTDELDLTWNGTNISIEATNNPQTINTSNGQTTWTGWLKNTNAGPNTGKITFTYDNGIDPPISVDTSNITVNKNDISGTITYNTPHNQTAGDTDIFVKAYLNSNHTGFISQTTVPYDGSTSYAYTLTGIDSLGNTGDANNVYIRVFRDHDSNNTYDNDNLEAVGTFAVTMDATDKTNKNVTITEPAQEITTIEITTQPAVSITSGEDVTVTARTKDQWGNYLSGSPGDAVNITSTNANVMLEGDPVSVSINGTDTATWTGWLKNTTTGSNSTQLHLEYNNDASVNINTSNITVGKNEISGTITYNTPHNQTAGDIEVKAYSDAGYTTLITGATTTVTYDGSTSYAYTLTNINSTGTVYIRAFRDFDGDNTYDTDDTEAVGTNNITMDGVDETVNITITEPAQAISSIEITTQPAVSITSGEDVTVTARTKDQWGSYLSGSVGDSIDISWAGSNVELESQPVSVSISGTDTATWTGWLKNTNAGPNTDSLLLEYNNDASVNINTTNISVGKNEISGTITYNTPHNQSAGDLEVKAYSDAGYTTLITGATTTITYDGSTSYAYTLTNINSTGTVYIRAFRDFDGDNTYDTDDTEAVGTNNITMTGVDETVNITITEPAQAISSIEITTQPAVSITSGEDVTVTARTKDQWGNYLSGSAGDAINITSTNANVMLESEPVSVSIDGTDTATWTGWLKNTNAGPNTDSLLLEYNNDASVNINTNNITVGKNSISGTITYNTPHNQTAGDIEVKAYSDAGYTTLITGATTTVTYDGSTSYAYTLTNISSDATVYIRAFRDYDGDNTYDTDDTEAVGTNNITMTGVDETVNITITEPAQAISSITITGADSSISPTTDNTSGGLTIYHQSDIYFEITTYDQWGNVFGDSGAETMEFDWTGTNVNFNGSAPPATGITIDSDGVTNTSLTLTNTNTTEQAGQIEVTYNGGTNPTDTTDGTITVAFHTIDLDITYDPEDNGSTQLYSGDIIVEMQYNSGGWNDVVHTFTPAGITEITETVPTIKAKYGDGTYEIRAYRDYDSDNTYDTDDTEAYGLISINISGANSTGNTLDMTEMTQAITSVDNITGEVLSTDPILHNETITFDIVTRDQWGNIYGDGATAVSHNLVITVDDPPNTSITVNSGGTVEADGTTSVEIQFSIVGGSGTDTGHIECTVGALTPINTLTFDMNRP